jgi:uncharacterized protein YPO0396
MLTGLQSDDLPRFEARFKELLKVNTIREIANFNGQLAIASGRPVQRAGRRSSTSRCASIDYNRDRYIKLVVTAEPGRRDPRFPAGPASLYRWSAPTAFVRTSSTRRRSSCRSRPSSTASVVARVLQTWIVAGRTKVTDVRNWIPVLGQRTLARRRWRARALLGLRWQVGRAEGEKLAYTVLAASLAYQFGLEWGAVRSRSFRFVVIDEAFGRGSDESAQYGLRLFQQLNLQLLIVTPLQKIHIIEPFVSSVGFVHNEGGSDSRLRCLSIEEYHVQKPAEKVAAP